MMFDILLFAFIIFFLAVFLLIIINFGITLGAFTSLWRTVARQQTQNQNSPEIAREARVIAKRQQVSDRRHEESGLGISTWYYVTFEFTDGSRTEFVVNPGDYGVLVEGDRGILRSQGSWFRGFDRFPQV